MKKYDKLELIIEENDRDFIFPDKWNRCKILINGKELLEIIADAEKVFAEKEPDLKDFIAGDYIYMIPSELYEKLKEAEQSNGKLEAAVLCCTCGEVGCASARVLVINTGTSVIWNHFRTIRDWDFNLSYEFLLDDYKKFLEKIKNTQNIVS